MATVKKRKTKKKNEKKWRSAMKRKGEMGKKKEGGGKDGVKKTILGYSLKINIFLCSLCT